MRIRIYRNSTDISDTVLVKDTRITKEYGGRTSTFEFTIVALSSADVPVSFWDEVKVYELTGTESSGTAPLFGSVEFGEALFGGVESSTLAEGDLIFGGYVTGISCQPFRKGPSPMVAYRIQVQDYNCLLDTTAASDANYSNQADNAILTALFASLLPTISTSGVSFVANITMEVAGMTMRNLLERMRDTSLADYYISSSKVLYYHSPASEPAAYSLSETPDNVDSFPFELASFDFRQDYSTPCNKCTVIGKLSVNTTPISQTYQDVTSQATYGVRAKTIVDRRVGSTAEALAKATAEVQQYAYPRSEGTVTFWQDGIEVGKLLTIYAPTYKCDGAYRINRLSMVWDNSKTRTTYTAEFGVFSPDLVRTLRLIAKLAEEAANTPVAVPSNESVGDDTLDRTYDPISITGGIGGDIATGTITGTNIADATITGGKIASATITGDNIANATITGGKIDTATITGDKIAVGTITGDRIDNATITGSKIASATITGANIDAATITGDKIAAATITGDRISAATITGSNLAAATITGDKIQDGTITGSEIAAATITGSNIQNAAISGSHIANSQITSDHIQNATITGTDIAALTISGTNIQSGAITAEKIQDFTITATEIANATITGDKIASLTITGANIASNAITADKIQDLSITANEIASATITGDKIAAATITGGNIQLLSLLGDHIQNATINASTKIIDASISAAKIDNLAISASHIQNLTITAEKIAALTITGAKLADGTITSVKISDLAVAKLTGWSGSVIDVGGGGMLFTGSGGNLFMAAGGYIGASPGYIWTSSYVQAWAGFRLQSAVGVAGPTAFISADGKVVWVQGGLVINIY